MDCGEEKPLPRWPRTHTLLVTNVLSLPLSLKTQVSSVMKYSPALCVGTVLCAISVSALHNAMRYLASLQRRPLRDSVTALLMLL